jgi:hypothetical protein
MLKFFFFLFEAIFSHAQETVRGTSECLPRAWCSGSASLSSSRPSSYSPLHFLPHRCSGSSFAPVSREATFPSSLLLSRHSYLYSVWTCLAAQRAPIVQALGRRADPRPRGQGSCCCSTLTISVYDLLRVSRCCRPSALSWAGARTPTPSQEVLMGPWAWSEGVES